MRVDICGTRVLYVVCDITSRGIYKNIRTYKGLISIIKASICGQKFRNRVGSSGAQPSAGRRSPEIFQQTEIFECAFIIILYFCCARHYDSARTINHLKNLL